MTTTSNFISRSATLVLFVPSSLLRSFVLMADSCLVGIATVLIALKYDLLAEAPRPSTSSSSVASRVLLSRALHRRHANLLLRRIRRSIIREILANAPAVGSKSIDKWRVRRQRQHHIQRIVAERASIEAGHLKCGGCSKLVRQCVGTKPCSDQLSVFTRVRRRTGIGRHLLCKICDRLRESLQIFRRNRRIELFFYLLIPR